MLPNTLLGPLVLALPTLALPISAPRTARRQMAAHDKLCPSAGARAGNSTTTTTTTLPGSGGVAITAATVQAIMPLAASCDGRGAECATAALAAPLLDAAMATYGVASAYERAGVLALVAYESVELQYRTNLDPKQKSLGRGTANMQSGDFNVEYANTFPELESMHLTTDNVLAQVTQDKYNFAAGAWYYMQQKTDACVKARAAARQSSTTAWIWFSTVYLRDCVGVNIMEQTGRTVYWNNALAAFGITNDTTNGALATA